MKLNIFIVVLSLVSLIGCLEEIIEPIIPLYHNSADLATYLELNGNYINSSENPALIDVEEVNQNLNSFLILDIRTNVEYTNGHIPKSINVEPRNIIEYLESIDNDNYSKIIIVCENGDHSGFVTTLLRLLKYNNTYSLNYGMGYWHRDFSSPWKSNKKIARTSGWFNNRQYGKRSVKATLPEVKFNDEELDIESKLKIRVQELLELSFDNLTITVTEFDDLYSGASRNYSYRYIICYGDKFLYDSLYYNEIRALPPVDWGGHPRDAVLYNPSYDFYLSSELLTIPANDNVLLYSYNGQRSSYMLAYLKLLGYDAKIIEYGAYSMLSPFFVDRSYIWHPKLHWLGPYIVWNSASKYNFWVEFIKDYEYEVGP